MEINRSKLKQKRGFEYRYGTGDIVAVYYNDKGNRAFQIVTIDEGYVSTKCIQGINQLFITYNEASKMCTEEERKLPPQEWKKIQIERICEAFENNYKEQVEKLKELL